MNSFVPHYCAAPECQEVVPVERLACQTHWYALPDALRQTILATYQPGQGSGRAPISGSYFEALRECLRYWRGLPSLPTPPRLPGMD